MRSPQEHLLPLPLIVSVPPFLSRPHSFCFSLTPGATEVRSGYRAGATRLDNDDEDGPDVGADARRLRSARPSHPSKGSLRDGTHVGRWASRPRGAPRSRPGGERAGSGRSGESVGSAHVGSRAVVEPET